MTYLLFCLSIANFYDYYDFFSLFIFLLSDLKCHFFSLSAAGWVGDVYRKIVIHKINIL